MLELVGDKCSGCSACANVCPKGCISMLPNFEGFPYPSVNLDLCVKCGLCEKTCPVLHPLAFENGDSPKAFAVQNKDENVRKNSTSGGAFSAIADYVLDRDGVVFGAMFDEHFDVVHGYVESKEDLNKLRRSKYVQSRIGNTFKQAKNFLDDGRWVCFSGTPCQIAGLKSFLKRPYEKLILVDIVCHGVPSPKFWEKYRKYQEKKYKSTIKYVDFRRKKYGYSSSILMMMEMTDGRQFFHGEEVDYMLKAFFSDIVTRKSCSQCCFKGVKRISDFTIFDCWGISKLDKSLDDNKGTSSFLIQSEKGKSIWCDISKSFRFSPVSINNLVALDKHVLHSTGSHPLRNKALENIDSIEFEKFCQTYFPITWKNRLKAFLKPWLYRLGILKIINDKNYKIK